MGCPVVASDCLVGPRELLDKLYDGSYVFKPQDQRDGDC